MLGSVALDVVIGLIFVYLLYSLLASIVQEFVSTIFGLRARMLCKAINRMLNDDSSSNNIFKGILEFFRFYWFPKKPDDSFAGKFYKNPMIKYLSSGKWHNKPSYMNAQIFSKVVMDLLKGNEIKPGDDPLPVILGYLEKSDNKVKKKKSKEFNGSETQAFLRSLLVDANNDLEKFKLSLESWYDTTMEQTTGWYKKHVQTTLFIIGLFIAVIFNVNTISIVNNLSKDKKAREQMVQLASAAGTKYQTTVYILDSLKKDTNKVYDSTWFENRNEILKAAYNTLNEDMQSANNVLSLGWPKYDSTDTAICKKVLPYNTAFQKKCKQCLTDSSTIKLRTKCQFRQNLHFWVKTGLISWKSILGWILTALAISLGAPFWFDLLSKLVNLRSSLKPKGEKDSKVKPETKQIERVG